MKEMNAEFKAMGLVIPDKKIPKDQRWELLKAARKDLEAGEGSEEK